MSVPGRPLLDRLLREGQLDHEQHERALLQAQRIGEHAEDALISIGAISELELLKYKASIYRTRFVSTQKLSKAQISSSVVRMVPRTLADKLGIFPILYDSNKQELSVVGADLETFDIRKQVQLAARVRTVAVYVARPAAIRALQQKHYEGDSQAFARAAASVGSGAAFTNQYYDEQYTPGADSSVMSSTSGFQVESAAEIRTGVRANKVTPPPNLFGPARRRTPPGDKGIRIEAPAVDMSVPEAAPAPEPPPPPPPEAKPQPPPAPREAPAPAAPPEVPVTFKAYVETLNVLVALLEQDRGELRGHSGQVARLARRVCERIDLAEQHLRPILIAAYVHDIGKSGPYHLTAFNVAQYEGHRVQARRVYLTGLRMLEAAGLPEASVRGLTHLYERIDGNGFPDRLSGKEIPLCARLIAIVETYCDLTSHAKNPFRKILDAKEACDILARYKGTYFDPTLVDVFRGVVLGDDLRSKLLADRPKVLIADPDAEETTVLELRLAESGYEVVITRTAEDALQRLDREIDLLVTEVALEPFDGFELIARALKERPDLPFVFLTTRGDGESVNRGFELGAADYLVKPASADVVSAKLRKVLAAAAAKPASGAGRGVSGSLREMSLPDVVQILSNGRKSGQLTIRDGSRSGDIYFNEGMIWDAEFDGRKGAEGVYAMLLLVDGEFTLDPEGRCSERVIKESPEGLLLEGMRRMDEGTR